MLTVAHSPKIPGNPQNKKADGEHLSAVQHRAIELLLAGQSSTATSAMIGIDRKTLYQWRKNPHFQAEFNRCQGEAMEASGQRLRLLSDTAISVIERHLEEGSLKAATALLKLVAAMAPPDTETNPQTLLKRQSEEALWAYWHRQPFAEKRFGRHSLNNAMFTEFCDEIHDHELRRFGIEFQSDVDGVMDALTGESSLKDRQSSATGGAT